MPLEPTVEPAQPPSIAMFGQVAFQARLGAEIHIAGIRQLDGVVPVNPRSHEDLDRTLSFAARAP